MERQKFLPEGWGGKLEEREFDKSKDSSLLLRCVELSVIIRGLIVIAWRR